MFFQHWRALLLLLTLTLITFSCGDQPHEDQDLRVVQQADILRAKLGESAKGFITLVNPTREPMQFTLTSHAPKNLLTTAITQGTLAPKTAQEIAVTATCPMQDGQFLLKMTATNDIPGTQPADIFLRLQCGWVAADPKTIGTLLVLIDGLPEHLKANITIEGPDQYLATIDTTTTIPGLPIGQYTLTAAPIIDNDDTYLAAPLIFKLPVTNDNKARANFTFLLERKPDDDED